MKPTPIKNGVGFVVYLFLRFLMKAFTKSCFFYVLH